MRVIRTVPICSLMSLLQFADSGGKVVLCRSCPALPDLQIGGVEVLRVAVLVVDPPTAHATPRPALLKGGNDDGVHGLAQLECLAPQPLVEVGGEAGAHNVFQC